MLKTILSISGKPGLYRLVSKGKSLLIVESLSADKKRFPAHGSEKIISLADIALYTDKEEAPLKDVLASIKEKENGAVISIDVKKASPDELRNYLSEVLPNYDREKVYINDIKRLISWYNILVTNGITEFREEEKAPEQDTHINS
jgi:polyphosphate kinase